MDGGPLDHTVDNNDKYRINGLSHIVLCQASVEKPVNKKGKRRSRKKKGEKIDDDEDEDIVVIDSLNSQVLSLPLYNIL